jgi:hypothetical protein
MIDIFHSWGGDLQVGSGGDLAISIGSDATSQRVFRRLLTNPGDYLWNLGYGGGLGQFVGTNVDPARIDGVIATQLALETSVPVNPQPKVSVVVTDAANGYVVANISYADPMSSTPIQLNVPVG